MKRISIIGASGFVGTRLIDQLKDRYTIVNFDKQQSRKYPELTTLVDIRNRESLKPLLQGFDLVVLLAAEHRDDVSPTSLYYDVNVEGTRNVLKVMEENGIGNIIFTSSVAVYGLNKKNPDENHPADPFNHYGKSKWQAEGVLREWYSENTNGKMLRILRPTVIFGERNRGNVYNLLKQISSGKFLKTGKCNNKKSMAYVGNIVAFIEYMIETAKPDYEVYNYIDKPDLSMNELVEVVGKSLNRKIPSVKIPYWLGMLGGYCFDFLAWLTRRKLSISSVRVRKFCATTQFDSGKVHSTEFIPPYTLSQGIDRTIKFEFVHEKEDDIVYVSE
ncbi:MAG: NAD-dependent epimerase/dehydratase family protein [Prevotellaceae bacterium]|jgi:nucleoside-diphosphate-sugar epimerase|nr:NAD-dependent epimerase/dehydratase family protein [Prevotellaceae bacterium]